MDTTFYNIHPGERVSEFENHFLKAIFKRQVKRVTAKTAKKAGLSPEKTKAFQAQTQKMITTGALGKKITQFNRAGNVLAIAAGTALTAGLATGAIAPGLFAAKGAAAIGGATAAKAGAGAGLLKGGGALAGIGTAAKKAISKAKTSVQNVVDPEPWLGGTQNKTTVGQAVNALKNIAKEKAPELIQGLKEKGLQKVAEIINDNQTSPELLPKTRPQKQLEATVLNGGSTPLAALDSMMKNPLVIVGIIVLIIAVVVSMVKRNA